MNKPTPGPWRAVTRGPFIATAENKVIARTVNATADPALNCQCATVADLEQCANAELIAAAPELLAALELVKASFSDDSHLRRYPAIWQMVNDAIAKAKGE